MLSCVVSIDVSSFLLLFHFDSVCAVQAVEEALAR